VEVENLEQALKLEETNSKLLMVFYKELGNLFFFKSEFVVWKLLVISIWKLIQTVLKSNKVIVEDKKHDGHNTCIQPVVFNNPKVTEVIGTFLDGLLGINSEWKYKSWSPS